MTKAEAQQGARRHAMARSVIYDVVRVPTRDVLYPESYDYDYFPRFIDSQGRTDKGEVVASYNSNGSRRDLEQEET